MFSATNSQHREVEVEQPLRRSSQHLANRDLAGDATAKHLSLHARHSEPRTRPLPSPRFSTFHLLSHAFFYTTSLIASLTSLPKCFPTRSSDPSGASRQSKAAAQLCGGKCDPRVFALKRKMARLNTRPSHSTAASSRYASRTPGPGASSDQENRDPSMASRNKGKERATDVSAPQRSSLPTPASDGSSDVRGQKRKRAEAAQNVEDDDDEDDEDEEARFNKYFDPNQDQEKRREVKRKSRALERDFQGKRIIQHCSHNADSVRRTTR